MKANTEEEPPINFRILSEYFKSQFLRYFENVCLSLL